MTDSNFHAESSDLVKHMLRYVHGRVYSFIPSHRNLMTEISELACLSVAAFLKAGWVEWVAEAKVREKDRASVGPDAVRHYLCLTAAGREIVGMRKGGCREDGCEALANSEEEPYSCQSCVDRLAGLRRERIAAVAKERSGRA